MTCDRAERPWTSHASYEPDLLLCQGGDRTRWSPRTLQLLETLKFIKREGIHKIYGWLFFNYKNKACLLQKLEQLTSMQSQIACVPSFLGQSPETIFVGGCICQEHLVHLCDADLSDSPTPTPVHWVTKGCAEKNLCEFLHTWFSFPWRTITNFSVV